MDKPDKKDVSDWYLGTIRDAELFDYGPVRGTIIIRPYGYAIWELIQKHLDSMIKALGCKNVYFPSLIPESFLSKEKEHIEGFSPELAVVTHAGGKKLEEPLVVRPTSETIMYSLFSKWINSWRDLPFKINQWVNVVRWELRPFPFLRTTEFLWQEGHTVHATPEESERQVYEILNLYKKFFEKILAIPVVIGKKTESEKFAGALYSASCEALLMDGKALQIATAHNLGQNFSKAFDINFLSETGERKIAWQTSWGISTRAIGGLILTHGDGKGLVLPPVIAPTQVIVIPIWKNDLERKSVMGIASSVFEELIVNNIRAEIDDREQFTPGWKFNQWELKGVPLRVEIGPRDVEKKQLILARRDLGEKTAVRLTEASNVIGNLLREIQSGLFDRANNFMKSNTFQADNLNEFLNILENRRGFIKAPWCGDSKCEKEIKEKTKATTRCLSLDPGEIKGVCINCGKPAKSIPIWARAY